MFFNPMEVIILGCGFSLGCPVIACNCKICTSADKYNKRMRSAILIRDKETTILVDFGPDIKTQLLEHNITKLDAIICTHDHADHTSGIDELRVFGFNTNKPIKLFSNKITLNSLSKKHNYLFTHHEGIAPPLEQVQIHDQDLVKIGNIEIQLFKQIHGFNMSLGIRANNFVYSNDVTEFPEENKIHLRTIDCWVVDCVGYNKTTAHSGLKEVLEWDKEFRPKKIYLTNMGHELEYQELLASLPNHIKPAHDGLKIDIG